MLYEKSYLSRGVTWRVQNLPFDHNHVGIHEIPGCVAPASWLHRHLWKVLPEERGGHRAAPRPGSPWRPRRPPVRSWFPFFNHQFCLTGWTLFRFSGCGKFVEQFSSVAGRAHLLLVLHLSAEGSDVHCRKMAMKNTIDRGLAKFGFVDRVKSGG